MPNPWVLGGRYTVRDRIGAGGVADVFRAHDELLGRDVAVKVFRTLAPDDASGGVERRDLELRALAQVNHPNLITLLDASTTERPAYLVMELVDGPSLARRLADGRIAEAEVRTIGAQIADGLTYVHTLGMVHRDVKPANILLDHHGVGPMGTGRARLSDFGIVRMVGTERLTDANLTIGTASYLAPEQVRGGDVDPSADVYSLGLVLIEALTGVRSFEGPPIEAAMARLTRSPEIPATVAPQWGELLAAMTVTDPDKRPTAAEVASALHRQAEMSQSGATISAIATTPMYMGGAAVGASAVGVAAGAGADAGNTDVLFDREPRLRASWLAAACIVLAVIATGGYFTMAGSPHTTLPPTRTVQTTQQTKHPTHHHTGDVSAILPSQADLSSAQRSTPRPAPTSAAPSISPTPTPTNPTTASSTAPPSTPAPTTTAAGTQTAQPTIIVQP